MDRRSFLTMAGATALGGNLFGQDKPKDKPAASGFQEVTPEQATAAEKALEWIKKNQSKRGAVGQTCQVAFTSIAGLALLAGGNTPTRGKYAPQVKAALKFMLDCTDRKTGYINEAGGRAMGGSGMHGHGYGLLFLAEIYGMCGDLNEEKEFEESLKEKLVKAVALTAKSQDPNGGWSYEPNPYGHEGSVTVTQVHALRACRNAGITVPKSTIEKGISYIKKSTDSSGAIMYSLGQGGGGSYALTAAGACVYAYYGLYEDKDAKRCMDRLFQMINGGGERNGHDAYATFYAAQACFFLKSVNPKFWTEGYAKIRTDIIRSLDKKSGGWTNDGYNGAFGTACAALALQIPYRFLPIFQD